MKDHKIVHEVKKEDKIPLWEQIIYGAGDLFGGGQAGMLSVILLVFFTDRIGIEAAIASTIIMVSKLWDAVSDPIMGIISDNTRMKLGRRKPYMILGGFLIPCALAFLFAPIQNFGEVSKITWMLVAYIVYCTVSTISQVPFMSMSRDISLDYSERNKANTWKLIFDMLASAIFYVVPQILYTALQDGKITQNQFYYTVVFGFGLFFGLPLIIAGLLIKERVPYNREEKAKINIKQYFEGLKVKSYLWHLGMYISAFLTMDIVSALTMYYVNYIGERAVIGTIGGMTLRVSGALFTAPMMASAGIAILFAYIIKAKKSKQVAFRFGLPLYILGAILLAIWTPSWPAWCIPLFAVVCGLGFGGAQSMPWLVFPDTVDVAELKLGYRPTANMSGVMTFSRKACTALGIGLVGWIMTGAGYVKPVLDTVTGEMVHQAQPASLLLAIRLMLALSVTILLVFGFISSIKYKVTNQKLERIRFFNEKRRNSGVNSFTSEERSEFDALRKELC